MPLRKIVTEKKVVEALNALPPATSEVMDTYYPSNIRRSHPSAYIRIDEIAQIAKAVPVVLRGSTPVSIGDGAGSINAIEPQPIDVIDPISGTDLNNLKHFDGTSEKIWLENRMLFARDTIRATSEALCIQSLSGKISFAMKTEDGMDTYDVKFGDILLYTPAKLLSATDADIATLLNIARGMKRRIKKAGGGTKVSFECAPNVFDKIVSLTQNLGSTSAVKVEHDGDSIKVGGFKFSSFDAEYYDPATKAYVAGIAAGTMKAIASDGGFAFRYLALDDIDAGLKPLPLYSKAIKREMPSGWIVNTMSKPLPIPNPSAICDATVL